MAVVNASLPQVTVTGDYRSYKERKARVTVSVTRADAQGAQTALTYQFVEHRMRINISLGGAQFGDAMVEIYGMPLQAMNQIARIWLESLRPVNTDTLAIDVWNGKDFIPLFKGVITWSAVDASAMPEAKLVIEANDTFALMNVAASPYSNAGPVNLQAAVTTIAAQAGFAVDWAESAPNFIETDLRVTGSPYDQIRTLLNAHPELSYFTRLQRLVVRKANAPFVADPIRVAADTGMQSFPVYSTSGLQLSTVFNDRIIPGASLDVETQFDFVNRTVWVANVISHQLEPNMPGGAWTSGVACIASGPKGNAR